MLVVVISAKTELVHCNVMEIRHSCQDTIIFCELSLCVSVCMGVLHRS